MKIGRFSSKAEEVVPLGLELLAIIRAVRCRYLAAANRLLTSSQLMTFQKAEM